MESDNDSNFKTTKGIIMLSETEYIVWNTIYATNQWDSQVRLVYFNVWHSNLS